MEAALPLLEREDAVCAAYVRNALTLLNESGSWLEIGMPLASDSNLWHNLVRVPLVQT